MNKKELLELLEGLPDDTKIVTYSLSSPTCEGHLTYKPEQQRSGVFTLFHTCNIFEPKRARARAARRARNWED